MFSTGSSLHWQPWLCVRDARRNLEIIVLRRQLTVLRRKNNRPALVEEDRSLLGAIASALPRLRRTRPVAEAGSSVALEWADTAA